MAVFPLALLLFTGLYLFVLPCPIKWRSGLRTDRTGGRPHDDGPEGVVMGGGEGNEYHVGDRAVWTMSYARH